MTTGRPAPLAALGAALLCALAAGSARAHTRSVSYSSWSLSDDGASVRARIPWLELSRLPPELLPAAPTPELAIGGYLAEKLVLRAGDAACEPLGDPERLPASEGWAAFAWRVRCPAPGALAIESGVLLEVAPSHLHFARVERAEAPALERVLSEAEPRFALGPVAGGGSAAGTSLGGYLALGVEHILTGWDHLAFVLALLLLAGTLGEVATLVTGFTVAHSVTLGVAVLGVLRPDAAAIEALIGLSIALVALEDGWLLGGRGRATPWLATGGLLALAPLAVVGVGALSPLTLLGVAAFTGCHFGLLARAPRPARLRAGVAFAFGLVHGFGFAGVLAELALPTGRLAAALFGFNAGVEIGQLGVVALVWPALRALSRARDPRPARLAREVGAACVCGLGLFWFVSRAFGG